MICSHDDEEGLMMMINENGVNFSCESTVYHTNDNVAAASEEASEQKFSHSETAQRGDSIADKEVVAYHMDDFDRKVVDAFPGKVVRKDLTALMKRGANVPTFVLEYLLGMYCSTDDDEAVKEGLARIRKILLENYVRPDESERIKSRIRELGVYTVIDQVSARLDEYKDIYVTSYEQILHFKQIFETAKSLGLDEKYINGLVHVPYGMVMLKTGKMSTRDGNVVKIEDLLKEAISKVKEIIENKNPELEDKDEIAKRVGIGAVIFNDLYNSRIKDEIFDWDIMLNFNGETGPYMQYIYVRTKSVLEKAGYIPEIKDVNFEKLLDEDSIKVIKLLYQFNDKIMQALDKYEPYIVARYLIEVAKAYSLFYNNNKVICDDKEIQDARVYLTYAAGIVLKTGAGLLGIKMPDKM